MPAHTPEQCDELFTRFANARDLEGLVSLYEPDAVLAQQSGEPARGAAAVRASLAGLLAAEPALEMKVVRKLAAGDDLAVLYSDYRIRMQGAPEPISGRSMIVVRRRPDGTWRILVDDPFVSAP